MADSPVISRELRDYMSKFKLEEVISTAVNKVAREMPVDPYGFLAGHFTALTEQGPLITDIHSRELLLDFGHTLEVAIQGNNKGQTHSAPPFVFSPGLREEQYDSDEHRKGCFAAVSAVETVKERLLQEDLFNQQRIDSLIESFEIGVNSKICLSFACLVAAGHFKNTPLYEHVYEAFTRKHWGHSPLPSVLMPLLYTGKTVGSKVKFSSFYVYETDPTRLQGYALYEAYKKIYENCKRSVSSGKGGEAAVKLHANGFVPNGDSLMDSLKLIEDSVTSAGFVLGEDFCIGIDCNAEEFYLREANKYEMDGFKVPPDAMGLLEFYVKLLTEKPYIRLLEDPFVLEDRAAWKMLLERTSARVTAKRVARTVEELRGLVEGEEEGFVPSVVSVHYTRLVSEVIDIAKEARKLGTKLTICENPVESTDTTLVDLAVGMKAEFLQISAPVKPGNLSKFNRLIQLRNTL